MLKKNTSIKKKVYIIAITAVILIPAILFFTMCLPLNHSAVAAEGGEVDLRTEDLEQR